MKPENIFHFGARTEGAMMMLLKLRDYNLTAEPRPKKASGGKAPGVYNKAVIDLLLQSKDNAARFMDGDFDEIRYTDHRRDNRGKLISVRAYFAKRVTGYREIT